MGLLTDVAWALRQAAVAHVAGNDCMRRRWPGTPCSRVKHVTHFPTMTRSPQVSELIGRFAEGTAEREAPIHALRKALHLVAADCKAAYVR